ncbi:MAG: mycofactocin-coupled SDR family oxidoreductase [Streptosporangiales bacterium]|nr:mycofactocin-coupled SDR family oxidoreductase [Streptosporangiales bacterium]
MSGLTGKVAIITGAGRGQGRAHAVRLAADGADIVAVDVCADAVHSVSYGLASPADLDETARLVRETGRRVRTAHADVRDAEAMRKVTADALAEFGRLDIVVANAGILSVSPSAELTGEQWQEMIDVNLTGVWNTVQPAIKPMIEAGSGGAIIMTSSTAGEKGLPGLPHYTAAKHGVIGLMKSLAIELGPHRIRVNAVLPAAADTPMVHNAATYKLFRPDLDTPTRSDFEEAIVTGNLLPIPLVAPEDIAAAVAHLAGDDARTVTGHAYRVDAGALTQ